MDRRKYIAQTTQIQAITQEHEMQEGVNTSNGYFLSQNSALFGITSKSIECYARLASVTPVNRASIFDTRGDSLNIRLDVTVDNNITTFCGGAFNPIQSNLNEFVHVVVAYSDDSKTGVLYFNGEFKQTLSSNLTEGLFFNIGALGSTGIRNFTGMIEYCRQFNYPLTADEVTTLYNNGKPQEYVLPSAMKYLYFSYQSDFSSGTNGWVKLPGTTTDITYADNMLNVTNINSIDYKMIRYVPSKPLINSAYNVTIELVPTTGSISRIEYYPYTGGKPITWDNVPSGTSILKGSISTQNTSNFSYFYFIGVQTPQTIKIKSITVEPIGCIAEYLSQNIDLKLDAWLDSAKQLPINDEYLPPLHESVGGYDLTANGSPEIIYKN